MPGPLAAQLAMSSWGRAQFLDAVTAAVFLAALGLLYFRKLKEPYVIGLAGVVGLLADAAGMLPVRSWARSMTSLPR